jgi:ribosomal protein S1
VSIFEHDLLPVVSNYTAEKLTAQHLMQWSLVGAIHKKELSAVIQKIHKDLNNSRSAAKTINKAIKNLQNFFERKEVRGTIHEVNHRTFFFNLSFPEQAGENLYFCLIKGEISGRSGSIKAYESKPILISFHALQRLFERLNARNDTEVLNEIYSCLNWADAWNFGGRKSGAQTWPIPSANGFFVAALGQDTESASTITWMGSDKLSKKWGLVSDCIRLLEKNHPNLLYDSNYLMEFLGSFAWMMQEHRPGVDLIKLAWSSKDFQLESEKDSIGTVNEELSNTLKDYENKFNVEEKLLEHPTKISISYIPGFNYHHDKPPFETHTQHHGIVVQVHRNGSLIISLRNLWYGKIANINNKKAEALGLHLKSLSMGDEIEVEVQRIKYLRNENAIAIDLDQKELADAKWLEIEDRYPVNSILNAEIYKKFRSDFVVELKDEVIGFLPHNQMNWLAHSKGYQIEELLKQNIDLIVTGYNKINRNLLLNVKDFNNVFEKLCADSMQIGMKIKGTTYKVANTYALVKLDSGFNAILPRFNCWGKDLPIIGARVDAEILKVDIQTTKIVIGFKPPENLGHIFKPSTPTEEKWELFEKNHIKGEKVRVQVIAKQTSNYLVIMTDNNFGILPYEEILWGHNIEKAKCILEIGDFIDVLIIDIKHKKKKIIFSKKALNHPLDDPKIGLKINDSFLGIIKTIKDYGYFVYLPFGMEGLLHKGELDETISFNEGDVINVFIKNIDIERKQISLSYLLDDQKVT